MHILIAPNAFKGSLTADAAAFAIEEGLMQSKLSCTCSRFPIGDGGDGTAELIIKRLNGQNVFHEVSDPIGRNVRSSFGLIDDGHTAVIEMANASGVRLLKHEELSPLSSTSYGTGQQIKLALEKGAKRIIIGMGGSATVDGGCGILKALGIRFLDAGSKDLVNIPESLIDLGKIDISGLDKRLHVCEVIVLCDVDNILLGEQGAAAIFGPQKGASGEEVRKLEAGLTKFSAVTKEVTGKDISAIKKGGTAGGAAAGLHAFLNAKLVNGIDYFLQFTEFDKALGKSEIVITGEGCIDEQTLQGKGPFGVASRAKHKGIPVIGLAGKVPLNRNHSLQQYFNVLLAIGHEPSDLATAMSSTPANLNRTAMQLGNLLSLMKGDQ